VSFRNNNKIIFLWGMMGVGKTTIGKKLAVKLNCGFIDLDHFIEQEGEKTISQLFSEKGESGFREIEFKALRALNLDQPLVVSTGGGTPCFHKNAEFMLERGLCIWLQGEAGFLASRLSRKKNERPLVESSLDREDLKRKLEALIESRKTYYGMANLNIEALHLDWPELLSQIELTPGE
jgi:shikimate kinase